MTCKVRKGFGLLGAAVLAFGFAAKAEAQVTYTCTLSSSQSKSWIPDVLFIGHDAAKTRVVVSDPIVLYFNDRQPVEGRISADNAKRITFAWNYVAKDSKGQTAKMLFRATWNKATEKMKVTATPAGFSKGSVGSGTCDRASL